jgi:hypothetical protein
MRSMLAAPSRDRRAHAPINESAKWNLLQVELTVGRMPQGVAWYMAKMKNATKPKRATEADNNSARGSGSPTVTRLKR